MTEAYRKRLIELARDLEESYYEHPYEHRCSRCASKINHLVGYILALEELPTESEGEEESHGK